MRMPAWDVFISINHPDHLESVESGNQVAVDHQINQGC